MRALKEWTMPLSIVTIAEELARAREHVLPGREAAATNEVAREQCALETARERQPLRLPGSCVVSVGVLADLGRAARLSKVRSVDQRISAWPSNAVSAFANCGRAVAHVRGSYGPSELVSP